MIHYRPTDGDAHVSKIAYRPRTCFVMTQLGEPLPDVIPEIRTRLFDRLAEHEIDVVDANSVVTGRDFLMKIWELIVEVPIGVAIIHHEMPPLTLSNIFYETGMMQAYGKETLVVKTKGAKVPSDLVRTEYIEYDDRFEDRLDMFAEALSERAEHYEEMAGLVERNPLLAVDYLKRAYLISGDAKLRERAKSVLEDADIADRAKNSVERLLVDF
jgi:hypothetical protein